MSLATPGEKILHAAVMETMQVPEGPAYGVLRQALIDYADAKPTRSFRWNDPADWVESNTRAGTKVPLFSKECGSPTWAKVRGTSYGELSDLLKTSGCGKTHPYYTWIVVGIIEDTHGTQVVMPGDWLVEIYPGRTIVFPHEEYVKMFVE